MALVIFQVNDRFNELYFDDLVLQFCLYGNRTLRLIEERESNLTALIAYNATTISMDIVGQCRPTYYNFGDKVEIQSIHRNLTKPRNERSAISWR